MLLLVWNLQNSYHYLQCLKDCSSCFVAAAITWTSLSACALSLWIVKCCSRELCESPCWDYCCGSILLCVCSKSTLTGSGVWSRLNFISLSLAVFRTSVKTSYMVRTSQNSLEAYRYIDCGSNTTYHMDLSSTHWSATSFRPHLLWV